MKCSGDKYQIMGSLWQFWLTRLVHNFKKNVKKVLKDTIRLSVKYSKPIELAMLGYREERLTLVGAEVQHQSRSGQREPKGVHSPQGIMSKVLETINGW